MRYELYIDVFIMTNGLMDFLVLMLTNEILHRRAGLLSMFLASLGAAIISALLFLKMSDYLWYQLTIHFLVNPVMLFYVFRGKGIKRLAEEWIICYLVMFLLGGSMQWLYLGLGKRQHFILWLLVALTIGVFVLCCLERYRRIEEKVYEVKICQEGKELELRAYCDSGTLLIDPFFREPVQIMDEALIGQIMDPKMHARLIPFCSLGRENGVIKVVTAEKMVVYKRKEQIEVKPVVLGLGRKELFQNAGYQMLLNEKILRG